MSKKFMRICTAVLVAGAIFFPALALGASAASSFTNVSVYSNLAPIAENLEYKTYRGVGVNGVLAAVDPEGDLITFRIVSQPKKGSIELNEDGSFIYTPANGKKGKDTFSYVAVDSIGNTSSEAKVTIRIEKQSTKITYSDMDGHPQEYAALRLAEEGIFIGSQLGSEYFFSPAESVTRGEFLAMCLKISDITTISQVSRTGFYDDSEIPAWVKPYVSTALMSGIISGYTNESGKLVFSSEREVNGYEAAVMLNNVLQISDVAPVSSFNGAVCPAWASQAVSNLISCDIATIGTTDYSLSLTRADAAELLLGALEVLEARDTGWSLLSWAR